MKPEERDYVIPVELPIIWKTTSDPKAEELSEYKAWLAVLWHDIISIQTYPYPDGVWVKFPGEKFYITIYQQGTHICHGSYKEMMATWKYFRKTYMPYNKL